MEDGLWTGKKMKKQNKNKNKKSSQTIDIVSYALKVSANGVKCVFVAHSSHQTHLKFVKWLNS